MSENDNKQEKNWDGWVIFLLIISGVITLFSFASPYIFTRIDESGNYDFNTETGVVGDTFGIMNPFIGILGVIMTFLAFYIQIKANKIQRDQFEKSIREDKLKEIRNEKIDAYNKLELLSVSLEAIINDLKEKGEKINEYGEKLKLHPSLSHILRRTPSRDYLRILEIDRLSVYKGLRFYSETNQNEDFFKLYNLLDFLPEFFEDFYSKVSSFTKESFEEKMMIRSKILQFLDQSAKLLVQYQQESEDPIKKTAIDLLNDTIKRNYEIIRSSYDEEGNPISETDWNEIDEKLLKHFIITAMELKDSGQLDFSLIPLIEFASNIRKDIHLVKHRALDFSKEIKSQYENLMIDNNNQESVINLLCGIQQKIKDIVSIAKAEIDNYYKF